MVVPKQTSKAPGKSHDPVPAAQYVRMSTDMQVYSPVSQRLAIAAFAAAEGYEIVATYADEGRSGVLLDRRPELQRLLSDVQRNNISFRAILVYDVSRWGRFQDTDESAHHEYLCRKAGVDVVYCAEQFVNDGTPVAAIVKGLKRAMAGEYSRELSCKVFGGISQSIEHGFHPGGHAGYGLRRAIVNPDRSVRTVMNWGEHKAVHSDRVILIPGPQSEILVVRRIFNLFVEKHMSVLGIANLLSGEGLFGETGGLWTRCMVKAVLTSERYVGNIVWNQCSRKLGSPTIRNAQETWLRAEGAVQAIVDKQIFLAAQARFASWRQHDPSDTTLIRKLEQIARQRGYLTTEIIRARENVQCMSACRYQLGGLRKTYERIGYTQRRSLDWVGRRIAAQREERAMVDRLDRLLRKNGCRVERSASDLHVNRVHVIAVRAMWYRYIGNLGPGWKIERAANNADFVLLLRLRAVSADGVDLLLMPGSALPKHAQWSATKAHEIDHFRCHDIAELLRLVLNTSVMEAVT